MDDKLKKILIWALTVLISFSAGCVITYPKEPSQLDAPTITKTHNDIWGITIEWDAVYYADGYKVYRGLKPDLYTKNSFDLNIDNGIVATPLVRKMLLHKDIQHVQDVGN